MLRRWLIVVTLVGLVLTSAAMTAHVSSTAHPVDVVVAAAQSVNSQSTAHAMHHSVIASDSMAAPEDVAGQTSIPCANCAGESTAGDHAMLMALGCAFVAMLMASLVVSVRSWGLAWMLESRRRVAPVLAAFLAALEPPNLLALGISRT